LLVVAVAVLVRQTARLAAAAVGQLLKLCLVLRPLEPLLLLLELEDQVAVMVELALLVEHLHSALIVPQLVAAAGQLVLLELLAALAHLEI
jgi:hypothetical protein